MKNLLTTIRNNKILSAIFLLLLLERLIVCLTLPPLWQPDTPSYIGPALSLLQWGTFGDMVFRTPGYPLFIAAIYAVCPHPEAVVVVQHLLGLFMVLLVIRLCPTGLTKIIAALFFLLDMHLLRYEHSLLADFPLAFLITTMLYVLVAYIRSGRERFLWLMSLLAAAATMVKPSAQLFIVVAGIVAGLRLARQCAAAVTLIRAAGALVVPCAVIILGWSAFNYSRINYFGLTPFLGYELAGVVENYMVLSSPVEPDVKKIYAKHLAARTPGERATVKGPVLLELKNRFGYTDVEVSRRFMAIAREAIRLHPFLYLRQGLRETVYFFLSNDSILPAYFPGLERSSFTADLAHGNRRNAAMKLFASWYAFHFLLLTGFFLYLVFFLRSLPGSAGTEIFYISLFIILSVLYVLGVSVFADLGVARYRTAVQPCMVLLSALGWQSVTGLLRRLINQWKT